MQWRKEILLEALVLSRNTLKYAQIMNNPVYTSNAELMIGQVHFELGNLDSSRYYLESGLAIAKDYESVENYLIGIEKMIYLEESAGNLESAVKYSKELKEKREEQRLNKRNKVVAGLEIQYESKRKDLELQAQELELETKQARILEHNYLIFALVLLVLVLILIFVLVRNRIT